VSILYETTSSGACVSGSVGALVDAALSGSTLRIGLDAVDEYEESQAVQSVAVHHVPSGDPIVAALTDPFATGPYGDVWEGSNPYLMHVVNTSNRFSWYLRLPSEHAGTIPSPAYNKSAQGRYGYYRWASDGRTRPVLARSDDPASMIDALATLKTSVDDFRLRFRIGVITYVARPTLTYWPKPNQSWLMRRRTTTPNMTTRCYPIPMPAFTSVQGATFLTTTGMGLAHPIVDSRGAVSLIWKPYYIGQSTNYGTQYVDALSTLVEILGPLN